MDVDKEIRCANARVQAIIDQRTREAIARMDARWPSPNTVVVEQPANAAEAYGQWLRAINDAVTELARGIARGWTAVDRAQQSGGHR